MLRNTLFSVSLALVLAGCGAKGIDDPANELPFGNVDAPSPGAQVKAEAVIAGWAMDDRGVTRVRVYVDGHLSSAGVLNQARPDVSKAHPQYTRGTHTHGFALTAGFDAPGPHTIVVQAVDTDGATRDIAVIPVTAVEK